MITKCIHFLKLLLITALITLLMSSIEKAPDAPIQFILLATTLILLIRCLWHSVLKDETLVMKQKNIVQLKHVHPKTKKKENVA